MEQAPAPISGLPVSSPVALDADESSAGAVAAVGGAAVAGPTVGRAERAGVLVRRGLWAALKVGLGVLLSAGLMLGLVVGGLFVAPSVGLAAYVADAPPRRPPIVPPDVPPGAREDWAVWSYVDKINQAWGKDWPLVIEWFEQLNARYPGNPMVLDKLYVAYLEDGRTLEARGDLAGARRRFEQAVDYDPDRGIAQEYLAALDRREGVTRR